MKEVSISDSEFMNRIERTRKQMEKNEIDALAIFGDSWHIANIFYLTNHITIDDSYNAPAFILLPLKEEPTIFVRDFMYGYTQIESKIKKVKLFEEIPKVLKDFQLSARPKKVGVERTFPIEILPVFLNDLIRKELGGAKVVSTDILLNQREIKSNTELELMKIAGDITSEAMKAAVETARAGRKEYEVGAAADCVIKSRGAAFGFSTLVGTGPQPALPLKRPWSTVIKNGDVIMMDMGALWKGYGSDMARSIPVGKVPAIAKEALEVAKKAFKEGHSKVKPGVKISEVDKIVREPIVEFFKKHKIEMWPGLYVGHGIGIENMELPEIVPENETPLKEGQTFALVADLFARGVAGIRFEDVVAVTDTGEKVLTSFDVDGIQ